MEYQLRILFITDHINFFFFLEYTWFKFFGPKYFDVVHSIEYSLSPTGRYFIKKGAKHVITVYDLIHEIFGATPNLYNKILRESFMKNAMGFYLYRILLSKISTNFIQTLLIIQIQ